MRINWPWVNLERRSDSYTDMAIAAIQSRAAGTTSNVLETAALEIAAGLYGRSMALATVTPTTGAAAAITAPVLAMMGRQLIRRGQAVL